MSRKRLSTGASRPTSAPSAKRLQSDERFSPYLSSITQCCDTADIDPSACIPMCLVREIQDNAVRKMKLLLTGKCKSPSVLLPGYMSGSPTSIVIPLEDELEDYLHQYWSSVLESEEDVKNTIRVHPTWYGIVDGNILHEAISQLQTELPSVWSDFKWKVTVLRKNLSIDDLRRLARAQNERNKKYYTYDVTIFDLLSNLRLEYDKLVEERKKEQDSFESSTSKNPKKSAVSSREVAQRYDCGEHETNTSVRQAAVIATKLSPRTIKTIGEVVNYSHADVIMKSKELNELALRTEDEVLGHHDCRLFKSFVCFGSLRAARAFMKAVETDHEEEQVNTIHRIRHYCELHNFKPVQGKVVAEQFELAKHARKEEETFLKAIGSNSWPKNMETARENLLRTTQCDRELTSNIGNDGDVIPSLWNCFRSLYPKRAEAIEKADLNTEEEQSPPTPPSSSLPATDEENGQSQDSQPEVEQLSAEQKEELRVAELQGSADKELQSAGIDIFEMPLSQFMSMSWSAKSTKADLVFSCITDVHEDDFMESLPEFCQMVMKPGSYAFFISTVSQFVSLNNSFKKIGFKVCEHPFEIIYDVSTVHRRALGDFPQKHGDIALLCCAPGNHPEKFHPFKKSNNLQTDASTSYENSDGTASESSKVDIDVVGRAQFASMLNVTTCRSKLKRPNSHAALYSWKNNIDVISRIIRTFSPHKGLVIDPFPGALSTALSCLKCYRSCISISPSDDNFGFARGRLRIHAVQDACLNELGDYSRPLKLEELGIEDKYSLKPEDGCGSEKADEEAPNPLVSDPLENDSQPRSSTADKGEYPTQQSQVSTDISSSNMEQSAAQALVCMKER